MEGGSPALPEHNQQNHQKQPVYLTETPIEQYEKILLSYWWTDQRPVKLLHIPYCLLIMFIIFDDAFS